jgi:hypothetical protein
MPIDCWILLALLYVAIGTTNGDKLVQGVDDAAMDEEYYGEVQTPAIMDGRRECLEDVVHPGDIGRGSSDL